MGGQQMTMEEMMQKFKNWSKCRDKREKEEKGNLQDVPQILTRVTWKLST